MLFGLLAAYVLSKYNFWGRNAIIVTIWAVTGPSGFFWPIFPILGWGFGLVMNAWDVYHGEDFSEEQIQREMRRLSS